MLGLQFLASISLGDVSDAISIFTPIILFFWFYYTQRQTLANNYYSELDGIYANFTENISGVKDEGSLNAGIIMSIREADDKGYFKGDFDFAETLINPRDLRFPVRNIIDGNHSFLGKMEFKIYFDKVRHPFKVKQNRVYKGTLYIVTRLDADFEKSSIEDYVSVEYDITHFREMQALKFTLKKVRKSDMVKLPREFLLHRKREVSFEPYTNLKQTVFVGQADTNK